MIHDEYDSYDLDWNEIVFIEFWLGNYAMFVALSIKYVLGDNS